MRAEAKMGGTGDSEELELEDLGLLFRCYYLCFLCRTSPTLCCTNKHQNALDRFEHLQTLQLLLCLFTDLDGSVDGYMIDDISYIDRSTSHSEIRQLANKYGECLITFKAS